MGAGREANHLVGENIGRLLLLILGHSFNDKTDGCGQDVKHFAEGQPGQEC